MKQSRGERPGRAPTHPGKYTELTVGGKVLIQTRWSEMSCDARVGKVLYRANPEPVLGVYLGDRSVNETTFRRKPMRTGKVVLLGIALAISQAAYAAAQNSPAPPLDPNSQGSVNDPTAPASSNRGDPGTEAINPTTGGPALGQGLPGVRTQPSTTGPTVPPSPRPNQTR